MSKYTPLADYLRNQITRRLSLTFRQIEGILGRPLPSSAYKHRPWWANEAEGSPCSINQRMAGGRMGNSRCRQGGTESHLCAADCVRIPLDLLA